jgi:hypothetical protein
MKDRRRAGDMFRRGAGARSVIGRHVPCTRPTPVQTPGYGANSASEEASDWASG